MSICKNEPHSSEIYNSYGLYVSDEAMNLICASGANHLIKDIIKSASERVEFELIGLLQFFVHFPSADKEIFIDIADADDESVFSVYSDISDFGEVDFSMWADYEVHLVIANGTLCMPHEIL